MSMEQCLGKKDNYGCIEPPLLNIDIHRIVLDELHLMLRVSDVLIRNMVWAMAAMDHKRELHDRQRTPMNMDKLISAIRQCGLSFQVCTYNTCGT